MTRLERLMQQIECVEDMFESRLLAMELANIHALFYRIEVVHQKVSLAEKKRQVKNECSPITSLKK